MGWRTVISRDASNGLTRTLLPPAVSTVPRTFSNIKTPLAAQKLGAAAQSKVAGLSGLGAFDPARAMRSAQISYRPRFTAHVALLAVGALVVLGNSQARAHSLSVQLQAAQVGGVSTLDAAGVANVAADIDQTGKLMAQTAAAQTATVKSQQVALLTTDTNTLAKVQVVATAGNATRDISSYVVKSGDTLSGIATHFGVTTDTILWANNLADANALAPGQSLTILPASGLLYIVKAGDTAESLASAYQSNAAQILSFNNAEVKGLIPGMQIIIPDGVKPQPAAPAPARVAASQGRVAGASIAAPRLTFFAGGANGYDFGYCTWYVANRRSIPGNWGNANQWYYSARSAGFSVGSMPIPGAIAQTGSGYYGHVAYVESVSGGMVTISEMNGSAGWGRVDTRTVPASSFNYIY